jgi:hypothetical protein
MPELDPSHIMQVGMSFFASALAIVGADECFLRNFRCDRRLPGVFPTVVVEELA